MGKDMDTGLCNTRRTEYMRDSGLLMSDKEKDMRDIVIIISMRENLQMVKQMEKGFTLG